MKKSILKKVIAAVCSSIIITGGVIIHNVTAKEIKCTNDIDIVPTMNDKIGPNSSWCGTFQLVWNEMKNEYAKQDIIFEEMTPMVENLNKEDFTKDMLSDEYYYINYGIPSLEVKQEIQKAIQTVMFTLDEKGGRVKSESILLATKDAFMDSTEKPRTFNIDDKFALFLREEGKDTPYFAVNVEDIKAFQ